MSLAFAQNGFTLWHSKLAATFMRLGHENHFNSVHSIAAEARWELYQKVQIRRTYESLVPSLTSS